MCWHWEWDKGIICSNYQSMIYAISSAVTVEEPVPRERDAWEGSKRPLLGLFTHGSEKPGKKPISVHIAEGNSTLTGWSVFRRNFWLAGLATGFLNPPVNTPAAAAAVCTHPHYRHAKTGKRKGTRCVIVGYMPHMSNLVVVMMMCGTDCATSP
jgi:hypothetical protein